MSARKANTPAITREQIVAAAIAVVDRDGLPALTMRKLAAELGVGVMSLYYHLPDKSALYDLILDAVMSAMDLSGDDPAAPAMERLVSAAYAIRRALLAHPNAVPIALSRSLRTPGQLRPIEAMLGILFDVGFDPATAVSAVDIVGHYVLGATAAYANHLADSEYHEGVTEEDVVGGITPEEFPNLMHAYSTTEYVGWERNFDLGVRALVDGLMMERC